MTDLELLVRDKYDGDSRFVTDEDRSRLASGEPLAYVIGWIPFLGLRIGLSSRPLIPRNETECWTERLIQHLRERFNTNPFHFLDLCAGSGAIGLSVLNTFPAAHVTFGEREAAHCQQIRENIERNNLDANRAQVIESDIFTRFTSVGAAFYFNVIACNPPYVPDGRALDASVINFEPEAALFSGTDGLELIRRIAKEVPAHINPGGEVWLEADVENIHAAAQLLHAGGATRTVILNDLYDRPRVVVAYYP